MIQEKAYPKFSENQVLTHTHLNNAVSYLEEEDRWSRIVDGSGILCGLKVSYVESGSDKYIKLSRGAGLTSKGYLIVNNNEKDKEGARTYTHYQDFVLPDTSKCSRSTYLYSDDTTDEDSKIPLYELLTDDKDPNDPNAINPNAKKIETPIPTESSETSITIKDDMAVILHLEIACADLAVCKIDSCDNEGERTQLRWRALVIRKSDLDKLLKKYIELETNNTIEAYFTSKYKVHEVRIPVPRFTCKNTQSYIQIYVNYLYICTMAVNDLESAFGKSKAAYARYIDSFDFDIVTLGEHLEHYRSIDNMKGIQYFYDHLKDVAMALNEFNDAAFVYHCDCSLQQDRYPYYLMAGSFGDTGEQDGKDDVYRHYFEPCCRDLASTNKKKELINLYKRVNAIIDHYDRGFIDDNGDTDTDEDDRLFITAESRLSGELGDLALPYYYNRDSTELQRRWNPHKFARGHGRDIPFYWDRNSAGPASWMQDPNSSLRFRRDRHDCFHIEGHLGMTIEQFKKTFKALKERFEFPFDVKILEAKNTENCTYEQPYANLNELVVLYDLEKEEILCFLGRLWDYFKQFQDVIDNVTYQAQLMKRKMLLDGIYKQFIITVNDYGGNLDPRQRRDLLENIAQEKAQDYFGGTPPYYYVERELETGTDPNPPVILEYPDVKENSNVLYSDGHVSTYQKEDQTFKTILRDYVGDDIPDRFLSQPLAESRTENSRAGDISATNMERSAETIALSDELIASTRDPAMVSELLALRAENRVLTFYSLPDGQRSYFLWPTITAIRDGRTYTFIDDYCSNIADGFIEKGNLSGALNILAGFILKVKGQIEDCSIESNHSDLQREINCLKNLSRKLVAFIAQDKDALLQIASDISILTKVSDPLRKHSTPRDSGPMTASNPEPADGAELSDRMVILGWMAGEGAKLHRLYFSTDVNDVVAADPNSMLVELAEPNNTTFDPGLLELDTNYFWRVDEVNEADPNSPWEGPVWNFSTSPKKAYNPDPPDGAKDVAIDAQLSWTPGFNAKLHTVYFGDDLDTVTNAVGGIPQGMTTYDPDPLEAEKTYYWRVDEFDGTTTTKGDVWSFTTSTPPQQKAYDPVPADQSTLMDAAGLTLSWSPGFGAKLHTVYFGEDNDTVSNATGGKPTPHTSYDPGLLEPLESEKTYYWRVDEFDGETTHKGDVWSFTIRGGQFQFDKCVVLPLLTSLYSQCWAKQFFEIKKKYEEIRETLVEGITFPQYVHTHPGIEHIGGVPKGGTFIVVYRNNHEEASNGLELPPLGESDFYSESELKKYTDFVNDRLGQVDIVYDDMGGNEIVADFCLPYLCCSDTSRIKYIVFAELKIDIPPKICNHHEKYPIKYAPVNATLHHGNSVEGDELNKDDGGNYYIIPKKMEPGDYSITIKLGDKFATYSFRIVKHPVADYDPVSEKPRLDTTENEYVWAFKPKPTPTNDDWSYTWYVTDSQGSLDVVRKSTYEHRWPKDPGHVEFSLRLVVSNGECEEEYESEEPWTYRSGVGFLRRMFGDHA